MAHFGPRVPALAMLVLVSGWAAPASAQLICNTSAAVVPTLRHEGFTELTGNITLTCAGAPGAMPTPIGMPIPQVNISVSLPATVTSRVLGTSPSVLTDALLLVDDPSPANQDPCLFPTNPAVGCQVAGDGGQTFNEPGKFNVFEGLAPSPNSVMFLGVPVDPPAMGVRTYRIANIRIDASSVTLTDGASLVQALVSSSSSALVEINTPQTYVAIVANGLAATTTGANPSLLQCVTYPRSVVGSATFTEDSPQSFKVKTTGVQNIPGEVYWSESGLEISLGSLQAGYADTGTRLQTFIGNIPAGVIIYVDNWAPSTATVCPDACSDATLVTGPGTPADPGVNTVTQVTDGSQSSVLVQWEVTNTNSLAIDSITFNIYASFTGVPAANQPVGALSGFSPQLAAYSSTGAIPEFSSTVNVAASPTTLFTLSPCPVISGAVTLAGNGLSGVAMMLSGSQDGATTTNSSGDFSFALVAGGNYTITPFLAGYNFTPPSQTFDDLMISQTANFTAAASIPSLRTLYEFPGGSAGSNPYGGVAIGNGGVLYGTAAFGGTSNHGAVFSLTPPASAGGVWTGTVLHSFTGGDGNDPQSGVVIGNGGVLYGAAGGKVFSLTPPASAGGAWTETVLYSIAGASGLAAGSGGLLYGTTPEGGASNLGTVFSLTPPASAGGAWTETVLHSFAGGSDGSHPLAGVTIGAGGVLYATTDAGGTAGNGTVFSLTPPASPGDAWTETVLYTFTGAGGAHPKSSVAIGSGGVLYGTTYYGGTSNLGTVFSLRPPTTAGGAWTRRVLHSFTGPAGDGAYPKAQVVMGSGGVLYGTTFGGGSATYCKVGSVAGCGTVFSLAPPASPTGAWTETVLHSFTGGSDGYVPTGGLAIGTSGGLYGTAANGGSSNDGTVFFVIP